MSFLGADLPGCGSKRKQDGMRIEPAFSAEQEKAFLRVFLPLLAGCIGILLLTIVLL